MSQEAFIRDVLKTWEMTNCRSLVKPGEDTKVELPVEQDVYPEDVISKIIDMAQYSDKTGYYLCTIQNICNGDESTKESTSGRYACPTVLKWNKESRFAV